MARNDKQIAKVVARQLSLRKMVRNLVLGGRTKHEAARLAGVGYDQVRLWTRDIERPKPSGYGNDDANDDYEPKPAAESTDTPVGSTERIEVYAKRVAAGQHWSHPWDSQFCERINGQHERW